MATSRTYPIPEPIADFTACIEIVSAGIPGLGRFAHDRGGGMIVVFMDFDALLAASPAAAQGRKMIPIKVVVTMFGQDTGVRPGEFQTWAE